MNASLFPYRCILSGLGPRPGIFYATILVRSRWMMATFIDEAAERETHKTHIRNITLDFSLTQDRILSKDPEPSGHWWSQRYPWDPVTILTEGLVSTWSLSSHWSPPPLSSLSLVGACVRSICSECRVWSPVCELCELLSFPRYNRARDHLY